jgi:hypothetical protein
VARGGDRRSHPRDEKRADERAEETLTHVTLLGVVEKTAAGV